MYMIWLPGYIHKLKIRYGGMNSGFWRELASSEEVKEYDKLIIYTR